MDKKELKEAIRKIRKDRVYGDFITLKNYGGKCFCIAEENLGTKKAYISISGNLDEDFYIKKLYSSFECYINKMGYTTKRAIMTKNVPYYDCDCTKIILMKDAKSEEEINNCFSCCERKILAVTVSRNREDINNYKKMTLNMRFYCRFFPCPMCSPFFDTRDRFYAFRFNTVRGHETINLERWSDN